MWLLLTWVCHIRISAAESNPTRADFDKSSKQHMRASGTPLYI